MKAFAICTSLVVTMHIDYSEPVAGDYVNTKILEDLKVENEEKARLK